MDEVECDRPISLLLVRLKAWTFEKMLIMKRVDISKNLIEFDKSFGCVVAGMDEVGRGSLVGPVVCACVVMPLDKPIDGINDSKKLSPVKREELYKKILAAATEVTVAMCDNKIIDEINILNATKKAMLSCIDKLKTSIDLLLVDAIKLQQKKFAVNAIIKGDELSYHIAAASIVAKVVRDGMMSRLHNIYSGYNFISNKGYGSAEHIRAIKEFGLCPLHRLSFTKKYTKEA